MKNANFESVRQELHREILVATKGSDGQRSRMPGFELTSDIREKISRVRTLLREGKMQEAVDVMKDTIQHLRGKQVAFARGAVGRLWRFITVNMVEDDLDDDLIAQARVKLEAFEVFVASRFDLDEAGRLFWLAENAIDRAYDEQNGRDRKAARKAAKQAKDKLEREQAEERERALKQAARARERASVTVDTDLEEGKKAAEAFDAMLGDLL